MEDKRSRMKRKIIIEDDSWDCSVCTYKNSKDAFTCEICESRKGTSTRKPRLNTMVVEQQQQIQKAILKEKVEEIPKKKVSYFKRESISIDDKRQRTRPNLPRLRNVDRSSSRNFEVTSNGLTVIITEYTKPPTVRRRSAAGVSLPAHSPSSTGGHSSNSATPASFSHSLSGGPGTGSNGIPSGHVLPLSPTPSSSSSSCLQANLTSTPYSTGDPLSNSTTGGPGSHGRSVHNPSNTGGAMFNGNGEIGALSPSNSLSLSSPSNTPGPVAAGNNSNQDSALHSNNNSGSSVGSGNPQQSRLQNHTGNAGVPDTSPTLRRSDHFNRSTADTKSTLSMSEGGNGQESSDMD